MWWRLAQGFALVVLLFWAGVFALYVFPGRSEQAQVTAPAPTPYVSACDRLRDQFLNGEGSIATQRFTDLPIPAALEMLRCGPVTTP